MITKVLLCDGKDCEARFGSDRRFVHTEYLRFASHGFGWVTVTVGRAPRTVDLCRECFSKIAEVDKDTAGIVHPQKSIQTRIIVDEAAVKVEKEGVLDP